MADVSAIPAKKKRQPGPALGDPPAREASPGNVKEVEPAKEKGKRSGGRPKLDYQTRQLGARVKVETFDRVQAIARRERVGLGPLVDRMVAAWEEQRLAQAERIGPRLEGEDDDAYITRVFKL